MLLASSDLRAISAARRRWLPCSSSSLLQMLIGLIALAALLALGAASTAKLKELHDDLRYGWPRTTQLDGFIGHQETRGLASHLIAINLQRHVVLIEFPGGDPSAPKVQVGPYLFGAHSDSTPVRMELRDMDQDGAPDLVLDIDNEWLVYLNKDGGFRLPTDDEQRRLVELTARERAANESR